MKSLIIFFFFSIHLFAGIGVGESIIGPVPVELTSFSAKIVGSNVELNWTTATEIQNYGFDIQRASSAKLHILCWENIGFVEGHGNSNSPKHYSYIDQIQNVSGHFSYRLKQIDTDGKFSFSDVISINVSQILDCFELCQNYPNPFNPVTIISYSIPKASNVNLVVYDVLGNIVKTLVTENQEAGNYTLSFDAIELSNGIYFYKLQADEFTAVKKMLLLK
ncbi:MAG: T9SS type A sorting domain-containing protein [Ignavibacteriaceae bacterium]|nr:T9SS type A sorting domain-containing protein [Ignavibacteriaceae bacterium]